MLSRSVRVGGYDLDEAIANYIRGAHVIAIGSQSAEAIKLAVGSAAPLESELTTTVRGRDLVSGLPREIELDSAEIRAALAGPVSEIMAAVQETLEETPPELAGDIARDGILLAGGGALLRGFDVRVEAETEIPRLPGRLAPHLRGRGRRAGARGARRAVAGVVAVPAIGQSAAEQARAGSASCRGSSGMRIATSSTKHQHQSSPGSSERMSG